MSPHQPGPSDAADQRPSDSGSAGPRTRDTTAGGTDATSGRTTRQRNRRKPRQRRRSSSRPPQQPRVAPPITYPEDLPVTQRRDDLLAAIRDHQVVIVAGETGSGKTTQLPKICLELGRGAYGLIGHTQPRRLAARTVAERIADELHTPLGSTIGYQVRFTDRVSRQSMVKVMTDGILLNEIQADRDLRKYDTLIIDEAHERSLNIDFILGHLKQLLPRRPDLKLVITSATIDPERFARHFADADGEPAPIVEVSGRTYPVEVRYRPVEDADEPDQIQAICDAVSELRREPPGDILIFASGEREIRDAADALRAMKLPHTEILPLYARLSTAEQHKVFQRHTGRRIVIATNVAETSLTVPGIKYVIDPGTARISRYSYRTKVQRLPIEPISQASANQRKGRCGRTSDGICIRLYSEADFESRPEFTDPEILRTNLASVILQMIAARLGDVATFPFIDGPDRRNITDGVRLLEELGALEQTNGRPDSRRLTPLGRKLAQLPVDPRLGRMVLEADRLNCVSDVLVIVAALSIQDPRERPSDQQQHADQMHARFVDKESDFMAYLNLWRYLREQQRALSSNQFRKLCRAEFLHYLRIREWQDVHSQLRQIAKSLKLNLNDEPAPADRIHTALLSGLLSHIGLKDGAKREYLGARNARFAIFPGSALFKKQPQWVMSAELVETSRLWARVNAKIEPSWIEPLAKHLVKRTYSEPHWEKKQGAVMGYERVTLYGVPIVTKRKINYGRVDPPLARELFIRHALVEGDWDTHHEFFAHNRELLDDVEELEHRARRRDILVDDETLYAFYDRHIPADVVSARHFDAWWKRARRDNPRLLHFDPSMLVNEGATTVSQADYPDFWEVDGLRLRLTYQFEPGTEADGVTVHIPLPLLGRVPPEPFEWQVPGLRHELITALLRSLPKPVRRNFVPVPDHAADVLEGLTGPEDGPLLAAVERELREITGIVVPRDAWQPDQVPPHLRMTFRVVDEAGGTVAESKDLAALQAQLKPKVRETVSEAATSIEKSGLTTWSIGTLPRTVEQVRAGHRVTAYPALADEGDSVAVRVFESDAEQQYAMRLGTRRLLMLNLPSPVTYTQGRLSNRQKLGLARGPYRNVVALLEDCAAAAIDDLVEAFGGPAWDEAGFTRLQEAVRPHLVDTVMEIVTTVEQILSTGYAVESRLSSQNPATAPALADIRSQLSGLIYPGFVSDVGAERLDDLRRYLTAIESRLDKLPGNIPRDRQLMHQVHDVTEAYAELVDELGPHREDVAEVRWMIEEFRVSLYAQHLGTAYPVSAKRIYRAVDRLLP